MIEPYTVTAINLDTMQAIIDDMEVVPLEVIDSVAFVAGPCCAGKYYVGCIRDYMQMSQPKQ